MYNLYRTKLIPPDKPGYYITLVIDDDWNHRTIVCETWYRATAAEALAMVSEGDEEDQKTISHQVEHYSDGCYSVAEWRIEEVTESGLRFKVERLSEESLAWAKERAVRDPDQHTGHYDPVQTGL